MLCLEAWHNAEAVALLMLWDQTRTQPSSWAEWYYMFFVFSLPFIWLFSNAEVFEDDIQDLLCSDPSSDPTQAGESQPDTLGCQSQVDVTVPLVLSQGCKTLLQMGPVAGLGQGGGTRQRVATPREEVWEQNEPEQSTVIILCFILYFWLSKDENQSKNKQT